MYLSYINISAFFLWIKSESKYCTLERIIKLFFNYKLTVTFIACQIDWISFIVNLYFTP